MDGHLTINEFLGQQSQAKGFRSSREIHESDIARGLRQIVRKLRCLKCGTLVRKLRKRFRPSLFKVFVSKGE